jgi:hypothetical protein
MSARRQRRDGAEPGRIITVRDGGYTVLVGEIFDTGLGDGTDASCGVGWVVLDHARGRIFLNMTDSDESLGAALDRGRQVVAEIRAGKFK